MSHLPNADTIISNLSKKAHKLSSSSESSDLSTAHTTSRSLLKPSSGYSKRTANLKGKEKSGEKKRVKGKPQSFVTTSITTIPHMPSSSVGATTTPLSIEDIIKKHVGAVDDAVAAATERARKNLGMPNKPLALASQTPPGTSVPHVTRSTVKGLPETPARTSFLSRPGSVQHSPPLQNSSLPIPGSSSSCASLDESSREPTDVTVLANHTSVSPHRTDSVESISVEGSQEEALNNIVTSQALLGGIESGSTASYHTKISRSSSLHAAGSPKPPRRMTASPSLSSTRSNSNKESSQADRISEEDSHNIAVYLRSSRLNRLIRLPRPFPNGPLQVSLADLGSPTGTPVLIFLGIGCVRHLIALFDDLARALGLRLICIDRWGFGKTTNVPQERRGPMEWAVVVERVLTALEVKDVRIIAHSAGAPYAAATALRLGDSVKGRINFLAPWIKAEIHSCKSPLLSSLKAKPRLQVAEMGTERGDQVCFCS